MKSMKYIALLSLIVCAQIASAQIKPNTRTVVSPPKKLWLFLLAGQSNMAGRGAVEAADTIPNSHVLILNKDGKWEIAKDPIHFDRDYAGVGPGFTFGKAILVKDTSVYIGLIPCAVGGSAIKSWKPNSGKNYQVALDRTRAAMQSGELKGIIWDQGETDCTEKGVIDYAEKMTDLINGFRTDLGNAKLPFIAGELPAFQMQQPDKAHQLVDNPYVQQINAVIHGLKGKITNYDYVTSEQTEHRGDHLHYNTVSARLMGERYAALMKKLLAISSK
ncbi:sialate O-acetylesterase [Mucilaginibacter sp. HMF5004]|uniref:sialate O-acetylesterase n=1 Tax=Mucilaginibacter rivuli TaxID=2857527 RepID=UPI001C5D442A|nr:sialate O-acetylesterase [Mucilaginibacter rivuli]MBW4888986.1 sialate O-acetylesterase [Mucilaginibacter rivuli]